MQTSAPATDVESVKTRLKNIWMAGDYDRFSRYMENGAREFSGTSRAVRRRQMLGRIDDGTPIGLLGYDDGEPVAWVSIAPMDTYRRPGGPEPADGEKVWSLACMFIRRDYRGKGLAHELIAAAVKQAKKRGATVEAYPVDPESPSYGYIWASCQRSSARDS